MNPLYLIPLFDLIIFICVILSEAKDLIKILHFVQNDTYISIPIYIIYLISIYTGLLIYDKRSLDSHT